MFIDLIQRVSPPTENAQFEAAHRMSFVFSTQLLFGNGHPQWIVFQVVWVSPTEKYFGFKVTHGKCYKIQSHPQKDAFVSTLHKGKNICLKVTHRKSKFTKEGFFEILPTEVQRRLGATHIWNKVFNEQSLLQKGQGYHAMFAGRTYGFACLALACTCLAVQHRQVGWRRHQQRGHLEQRFHRPEHRRMVARTLCEHHQYRQTQTTDSVRNNSGFILRVIRPQTLCVSVSCLCLHGPCPVLPERTLFFPALTTRKACTH